MAADQATAQRVRKRLQSRADVTERRMFGGLAIMISGNMLLAVGSDHLTVRVGKHGHNAALAHEHAREMRFTGRSMAGYVTVDPPGYESNEDLDHWIDTALAHVSALPPK